MERDFQKFDGEVIADVPEYIRSFTDGSSDFEIFVGTDSQVYGSYTKFVTAICMYDGDRGAHIIYHPDKVYRDEVELFNRLWEEAQTTVEVAGYLSEELGSSNITIHFDINPNEEYRSNVTYKAATGLASSAGFNFNMKPEAWAATCAADHLN